jgi:two-component system nitrogen regulation response regulator GlnG
MDIANIELSKAIRGFSPAATETMLSYPWPGNVRQLRSVVRRAVLLAEDHIAEEHLGLSPLANPQSSPPLGLAALAAEKQIAEAPWPSAKAADDLSLREIVHSNLVHVERTAIVHVLRRTGGNKAKAARLLQVDYKTLHSKVKAYGIEIEGVHAHEQEAQ